MEQSAARCTGEVVFSTLTCMALYHHTCIRAAYLLISLALASSKFAYVRFDYLALLHSRFPYTCNTSHPIIKLIASQGNTDYRWYVHSRILEIVHCMILEGCLPACSSHIYFNKYCYWYCCCCHDFLLCLLNIHNLLLIIYSNLLTVHSRTD